MSLESMKKQRGVIKSKLTRFKNFIENPANNEKFSEIDERLSKFTLLDAEFDVIQDKIETPIAADNINLLTAETLEREGFEDEYYRLLALAKDLLNRNGSNRADLSVNSVQQDPAASATSILKQLPTLSVPKFDGNLSKWIKFRDSFISLVHSQVTFSNIDKFNYLNQALEGEAARAIQSLGISESNYDHAWKKLKDRYEDSGELIEYHTRSLCELAAMTKASYTDLRRIIDDVSNHLAALDKLGESTSKCDSLLIYLISKKLDVESKKLWDKRILSSTDKRKFIDFIAVLESHCKYLQKTSINQQISSSTNQKWQSNTKGNRKSYEQVTAHAATTSNCPVCNEKHSIYSCRTFKALTIPARIDKAKELGLCFNCLGLDHQSRFCIFGSCKKCNRRHNTLLHLVKQNSNVQRSSTSVENEVIEQPAALTTQVSSTVVSQVLLGTAILEIQDWQGNFHECRALLDSGSQVHFVTQELCNKLNINKARSETTVSGIHQSKIDLKFKTLLYIRSKTTGFKTSITCLITHKITENMPNIRINKHFIQIPPGIELADPYFDKSRPIDLLIGAGLFWDLLCVGQIKTSRDQPFLQKTKLGWIVTGSVQSELSSSREVSCHMVTNSQLHEQLEKFWNIDECNQRSGAPPLDLMDPCEQYFTSTLETNDSGRFIVALPFNEYKEQLGDSYNLAYKRLLSMEKKFMKFPELQTGYRAFMQEYEDLQHMSKVLPQNMKEENTAYYLPHHAVFKEQSTTTKLRVVFDGSAKTSSGLSLNDTQHTGYEVQDELFCILLRFRKHRYILAADATKMYRQVLIKEDDRRFQRILWRSEPSQSVNIYQLNTVTYGTRAAAFLAKRCLRQIGEENREKYSNCSNVIINDFYVDDLLTGTETIESAKQLKQELAEILATRGFELRKWASNDSQIIDKDSAKDVNIQVDKDPKTLGLKWITSSDKLCITVNPQNNHKISKRTILSQIAQIFDPLGLVAPVTIRAKMILQKLWQLHLDWDESLPQELHTTWKDFQRCLIDLNRIEIPRRAVENYHMQLELHGFSDASESAFGACIYLRSTDETGNHATHQLCAKSKVAPLKQVSIPRLELCAAVLLAKLANKSARALNINIENQYYWSDSMITLAWIKGQSSRWKTFVANRSAEIQRLTNSNWNHVPSEENPADLISRGTDPTDLINSALWWHGPSWLSQDISEWPIREIEQIIEIPEIKNTQTALVSTNYDFEIFNKFSSWTYLTRVIAYCFKFVSLARNKIEKSDESYKLTTDELKQAQIIIIKLAQQQMFLEEINDLRKTGQVGRASKLISLNPFIDVHGVIRVGGRLQNAPIPFEQKHPIILPANHPLSWLIIEHEHKRLMHAGCQALMSSLRTKYWPISAKSMVKKVVKKCVTCVRLQGVTIKYIMGNLPSARLTPTRPFFVSGVDYAGPLFLKEKTRSRVTVKAYICIFVCFATKAVHIELAHDLSTEAFLNCLRRFISRRGRCQKIYSDNGLNFVGARNELNELGCLLRDRKFQSDVSIFTNKEQMAWHMNPPYAPHFGGLWESAVKSAKFHLKRVIGETRLTYEEMYTVLTQIEACLNSRPLYPLSEDPNDLSPLTPAHFLIGESLMALPEPDIRDCPVNRLSRYQHLQYMTQHFWKRWQREYLHGLQQRSKWSKDMSNPLRPGMMVILRDDNLPPTRWRLGRVVQEHPGSDNRTRVVSIRTASGITTRPVVKVVPLPVAAEDETQAEQSKSQLS